MITRAALSLSLVAILTVGCIVLQTDGRNSLLAHATTDPDNAISVRSMSTRYDSEFETFHVFGEVTNNLKIHVKDIILNVTFFDEQGNVTGNVLGAPFFDSLRPGERSPFDLVVQGNFASKLLDFSYYKISRTWQESTEARERLLRLDIWEISVDQCGDYYRVGGTVTNLSNTATSNITVSAAFHNEQNQIVAAALTKIEDRLDPTKFAEFEVIVDREALPHFAYYSFNVRSDEYGSTAIEGEEDLSNFHSLRPIGGKIMTVMTEHLIYSVDDDGMNVSGQVPVEEVRNHEENSLVVLKVVTSAGQIPEQATAVVTANGTFSREIEFQMDENMEGQVFRMRAEYFGMTAENTFSIGYSSTAQQISCQNQKIAISELNAIQDGSSGGVIDLLSGRELKLGSNTTLSAILVNELSSTQNVTVIFEVFDEEGIVVALYVVESQLDPNNREELQAPWLPEAPGTFVIKSFAVSSLDHPVLLSSGAPLSINVV